MRYWYDTEFIEDGKTIDLISIAVVAQDGRELSMQSTEFDPSKASLWVKENVFPHLVHCPHMDIRGDTSLSEEIFKHAGQWTFAHPAKDIIGPDSEKPPQLLPYADCPWRTREQIRDEILSFMDPEKHGNPELWANYGAYDHLVFFWLFGSMVHHPNGYPTLTLDIEQWCYHLGNPVLPKQTTQEHNALNDARWNKLAWEFLKESEKPIHSQSNPMRTLP